MEGGAHLEPGPGGMAGSNAMISLFALDRKYFSLKERAPRLQSEAWLYASLSGKYK